MRNKLAYKIIRILLGVGFVLFGALKFFPSSSSAALPAPAMDFMTAMASTGYFIPFLGLSEVLVGVLLIFNLWVPLSMIILAPIMLNIILFNLFLGPSLMGFIIVGLLLLLQMYVVYYSWDKYKSLFTKVK